MIKKFYIEDFQLLYDHGGIAEGYFIDAPVEGLDNPVIRISNYEKPGEDGGVIPNIFYSTRLVTAPGTIIGSSAQDYRRKRQALAAACAYSKDANGYPVLKKFTIVTDDDEVYFFNGIVKEVKWATNFYQFTKFLLSIVSPDPFLYREGAQTSGAISIPIAGGIVYPIIYPATYGASSGGSALIQIDTNAASFPILTITGQVTNPYITNTSTGEFIQLNITTAGSDVLVVDMAEKTITLNGTSVLQDKIGDSTWWKVEPGVNNISFSTSSASDTGSLEITWYEAVLGI